MTGNLSCCARLLARLALPSLAQADIRDADCYSLSHALATIVPHIIPISIEVCRRFKKTNTPLYFYLQTESRKRLELELCHPTDQKLEEYGDDPVP